MNVFKTLWIVILSTSCLSVNGQQVPVLSSYSMNSYLSNPANAGLHGNNLSVFTRNQWHDNTNAPETFMVTMDGNLNNEKSGIGMVAYYDEINVLNRSGAYGTYSYRLFLRQKSILTFGLSFGLEQNNIKKERQNTEVPLEIYLSNGNTEETNLNGNFGIGYQNGNLNIGFAGYRLFDDNNIILVDESKSNYDYFFKKHFVTTASYRIAVKPRAVFLEPKVQLRSSKGLTPQIDASLLTYFKEKFWFGAGYRQIYGMDFQVGINLFKQLNLGYTFALNSNPRNGLNPYTNELVASFKFGKRNLLKDTDHDGVPDYLDKEISTAYGCEVDKLGVALDADLDNVPDCKDKEMNTPFGAAVSAEGVALDSDKDGVIDLYDQEKDTPEGSEVDSFGVSVKLMALVEEFEKKVFKVDEVDAAIVVEKDVEPKKVELIDTDGDHVADDFDLEINTPHWKHVKGDPSIDASGCIVNPHGVAMDSDGDGVMDCIDNEIFSPEGAKVDKNGVALVQAHKVITEPIEDSDGDGISDDLDLEPNTAKGVKTDQWGRTLSKKKSQPAASHRVSVDEIEDNSGEFNYYVIIGVFRYYNNLKNYQKYLLQTYNEKTNVLVTDKNYYYIWTKQVNTQLEASDEINRLNSTKLKEYVVGNPWLWKSPKK